MSGQDPTDFDSPMDLLDASAIRVVRCSNVYSLSSCIITLSPGWDVDGVTTKKDVTISHRGLSGPVQRDQNEQP